MIQRLVDDHGRTVLLSTHNLIEAEELCDRIGIMRQGRLLTIGNPRALRRQLGGVSGARFTTDEDQTNELLAALAAGDGR